MRRLFKHSLFIAAFFIAWIGVSITPFFDTNTVTAEYILTEHRLGFPLPIIEQNTSLTPMEDAFPFELGLVSPWEHPTQLLLGNYFVLISLAGTGIYVFLLSMELVAGIVKNKRY